MWKRTLEWIDLFGPLVLLGGGQAWTLKVAGTPWQGIITCCAASAVLWGMAFSAGRRTR